jgi:hypothetical protein
VRYSELTLRHFRAATHARAPGVDDVVMAEAGDPASGTWIRWWLELSPDRINDAGFAALACPHVIAVVDWLCGRAVGMPLPLGELPERISALRARFEVPVEKLGRLLTVEDAWGNVSQAANLALKNR